MGLQVLGGIGGGGVGSGAAGLSTIAEEGSAPPSGPLDATANVPGSPGRHRAGRNTGRKTMMKQETHRGGLQTLRKSPSRPNMRRVGSSGSNGGRPELRRLGSTGSHGNRERAAQVHKKHATVGAVRLYNVAVQITLSTR